MKGRPVNGQVSNVEDRLREAYRAAAQTIAPDGIRALHEPVTVIAPGRAGRAARQEFRGWRRAARGRVLLPLAAAAAIVAIVAGIPALRSGVLPGASHPAGATPGTGAPARGAPAATKPSPTRPPAGTKAAHRKGVPRLAVPVGAPPFFLTTDGGPGTTLYVYRTATAQVVAQVTVPRPGDNFDAAAAVSDMWAGPAATSATSGYVVAVGHAFTCGTRLYSLRLRPDGQPAGYTPLAVPTLPEDVISLAVTPGGRSLAYAGDYCTDPGGGQGDIGYVNLATRAISRWTAPKQEDIGSLTLSADGGEIGFVVEPTKLFAPEAGLLATDAASGTLAQRAQVLVSARQLRPAETVPEGAVFAPDGRTMYVCGAGVQFGSTPAPTTPDPLVTVVDGTLTHTTHLAAAGPCGLSLDPSGRYLLAQTSGWYGSGGPGVQLIDLTTGRSTTLPVPRASLEQGASVFW